MVSISVLGGLGWLERLSESGKLSKFGIRSNSYLGLNTGATTVPGFDLKKILCVSVYLQANIFDTTKTFSSSSYALQIVCR